MESTKKKWKTKYAIMSASAFSLMALSIPMVYESAKAHLVNATSAVSYMAWDEESKTVKKVSGGCENYTAVTNVLTDWSEGWYVVDGSVNISSRVNITGEANVILCDGAMLHVQKGIGGNASSSINIYAQSTGDNAGTLFAEADNYYAAIGGGEATPFGDITIHGGKIITVAHDYGAGIGAGAYDGNCGEITINGGNIEAYGGTQAASIGGGECGDVAAITINGGEISAVGNPYDGAGIGSGLDSKCETITINGGTVRATGYERGAGIGGNEFDTYHAAEGEYSCKTIAINGGTIYATGGNYAAAIGSGGESSCKTVTISGGTIEATGKNMGAAIGSGYKGTIEEIIITDQVTSLEVTKDSESTADCIGAGEDGTCGSVTICGVSGAVSANEYTAQKVHFDLDGGKFTDNNYPKIYKQGISVKLPTNVVKEGYVFVGWEDHYGDSVTEITEEDDFYDDMNVYKARWLSNKAYEIYNAIEDLPEEKDLTKDYEEEVYNLWDAWNALDYNEQSLILQLDDDALYKLSYSMNVVDTLVAQSVTDLINALPAVENITLKDRADINAAKEAYDALNNIQKDMVEEATVTKLNNAVNRITELEQSAEGIIEAVDSLPEVKNITLEDKDDIFAAKEAYDALPSEEKENVPAETLNKLLEAVDAINTLVAEDMTNDIEALPEVGTVTIEDKDEIEATIAKYEALTQEQKEKLSPETITKIEAVKQELNDVIVANEVVEAINALPAVENITLDDKNAIIAAKQAYEALTPEQKAKVDPAVVAALEAATKEIDDLEKAKEVTDAINTLPNADSITISDKEAIEAANAKYKALTQEQKDKLSPETVTKIKAVNDAYDTVVAADVTNDINELPSVDDIDLDDKETIENVITKYESLTEKQKAKLSDEVVEKYNKAVQEYETLKNVYEAIDALKDASEIATQDAQSIYNARELYNSLTPAQKQKLPIDIFIKLEEAEQALDVVVVNEAETLVKNLGNITIDDKEAIKEAREAYEALSNEQKEMFSAETLELLVNSEKAFETISKINEIGKIDNSEATKEAIKQAKAAYDALTPEQKALLGEAYVEKLLDSVAVQEVIDVINEIGDVKYDTDNKEAIKEAREAYEALTNEQKEIFPAETLKDIENAEKVYDVLEKIYSIGDVDYDDASEEKINEALAAYNALTEEQKAMVDKEAVSKLQNSQESYNSKRNSVNAVSTSLLVVSSVALVGGAVLLFFLLKGLKKGKGVQVNSFGLGLTTLIILANHYGDAPFIVAYILAALAVMVWIAVLVVFLKKRQMKKAATTNSAAANNGVNKENFEANPAVTNERLANVVPPLQVNKDEDEEEVATVKDEKGNILQIRFVKSFTAKLIQAEEETKKYYEELKNEVLSYKKTNSRISWHFDSVNSGRNYVLKFAIRGKTLGVYLPLNADDYADSKYKVEKLTSKKYEDVPCLYRIKNDRRCDYAKELIAVVASNLGLEKGEEQHEIYSNLPYEDSASLIKRGLIKELKIQINKPEEESAILETKVNSDGDEVVTTKDNKGNIFEIRYIKSFLAKLSQSDDEVKNYYNVLKNYALSYKKANSRVSWHFDSINVDRNQVIKFAIRGKTLCLYYALNADNYADSKYKVEKVESKKFIDVPCLYRIKNDRRCEYAKELIDTVMNNIQIEKGKDSNEDYSVPFESTKALLEKGLIKEVKTKVESKEEPINTVTVEKADELMSDEKAEESIVIHNVNHHKEGKKGIINVDTLSDNYSDGEEVTLDSLIEKGLISSNVAYVKVLARGSLNKKLIVDLDDYSLQAVKMIVLLGGKVKKIN